MGKQAIEATRLNAFAVDPRDLVLVTDKTHPLYDERVNLPVEESLILSIMQSGVLQNVIVRKNGDSIEVVDGRQRVKAAIEASKRLEANGKQGVKVPVFVRRGEDVDTLGIAIAANEHRTEDSVLIKAKKVARLLEMGMSEYEASISFGVTVPTIKNWLKLLDTDKSVQKAVGAGKISLTEAVKTFASIPREEQAKAIEKVADAPVIKKTRTGKVKQQKRPGVSKANLRKVIVACKKSGEIISDRELALLEWVAGLISDKAIIDMFPTLKEVL